mmetsp:Transcript_20539/g.63896  ORF Transcript_20539/g.63896 Transcript_20539/m.63896 type:complete len:198 (+) Transcript_20539:28-621(+)
MLHPDYDPRRHAQNDRQNALDSLVRERARKQKCVQRGPSNVCQQRPTRTVLSANPPPVVDAAQRRPLSARDFLHRPQSRPAPSLAQAGRGVRRNGPIVDPFAGDRMDIDAMTYEELLALQDTVGVVEVGVPAEMLSTFPLWRAKAASGLECAVCFDSADGNAVFRCLPCRHRFHRDCIDPWLRSHKTCPVCKTDVTA